MNCLDNLVSGDGSHRNEYHGGKHRDARPIDSQPGYAAESHTHIGERKHNHGG